MNGQTEAKPSPLDISFLKAKYLTPILERKWLVIAFFISGSIVSLILSSFIKPEFYSIASLLVQEPRSKISSGTQTNPMVPRTADETYVLSEAESLRSIPLVTEVLKILPEKVKEDLDTNLDPYAQIITGLKNAAKNWLGLRWIFSSDTSEARNIIPVSRTDIKKERLGALQDRVIIKSKSKNAMIWITARSANKYAAPIIVKSYVSVWMARNLEENKRAILIEKAFATEQRDMARKHLNEAAKNLMDFRTHYEIPTYMSPETGLGDMELQSEFARLQGQVEGAKERFEYLDQIVLKLQMEEAGIAENIKLLDSPTSPGSPAKTLKQEILLMGILGGLGVGIGIALGLDYLKNPIRHEKDITTAVEVPIFGYIPKI
jgi:uncharacterized protein involved in exopolysaccharide biosynthesis